MINALDLCPWNWICDGQGRPEKFISLIPITGPSEDTQDEFEWLINGKDEGDWYPIPLTPELMETAGWKLTRGNPKLDGARICSMRIDEDYRIPPLLINFVIADEWGKWKKGDIVFWDQMVQHLHQIQNIYRQKTSSSLPIEFPENTIIKISP